MSDDDQTLPTIRLGHKDWPVSEFVWRDTKVLLPKMRAIARMDWQAITEGDMQLLGDVMHLAINRVNGGVPREDFDALPISIRQIVDAMPVIAKQADLEAPAPGEVPAQPVSTGTS